MPFRICKTFEIESGHLLSKHPEKCRYPHGHSRTVEVVLAADRLDANDMVCDFGRVKAALEAFLETWDHALCLNTSDPHFAFYQQAYGDRIIPFAQTDPTSEVMARVVFEELQRRLASAATASAARPLPPGVRVERVRVTETRTTWAEYFA
ncbi:MAG TPA: 6-carboxytetrahydropterin synthase [Opitutaceae bacterium]|nr:6-carboxytetrahydropterin synthase [Opitutaceae bacterium]